jgi:hypothetical protein
MAGRRTSSARIGRILRLAMLIGLVVGAALAAPLVIEALEARSERLAAEPNPIPANDTEQKEIVAALLDTAGWPRDLRRTLVDATLPLCGRDEHPLEGTECPEDRDVASLSLRRPVDNMPLKLRQELVLANRHPRPLADPGVAHVAMVSAVAIDRMFADGVDTGWERFYRAHPASDGFERYSIAVLTADRREAMILQERSCGGLCGSGALIRLERLKDGWRVVAVTGLWVS